MQKLAELCHKHQGKGSDQWEIYLNKYDKLFENLQEKPISLLEISLQNGRSLEILSQSFKNGNIFIGCDIKIFKFSVNQVNK